MDLISELTSLAIAAAVIYWLGRHEHARLSKTSDRKRVHGRYIPEWVVLGFVSPAVFMLCNDIQVFTGYPGALGMCLFGLLVGLAIGWCHGSLRLRWQPDFDTVNNASPLHTTDDGNPYRPPRGG